MLSFDTTPDTGSSGTSIHVSSEREDYDRERKRLEFSRATGVELEWWEDPPEGWEREIES